MNFQISGFAPAERAATVPLGNVAVVDMNKVFASHKVLLAKNEEVKQELIRAQEGLKALTDSARTTRILAIRGGILDGSPIGEEDVKNLATLPPVDVLRGQVIGAITAPLMTVVGLISAPVRDLIGLIDARIEQLQAQGDTSASDAPATEEPVAAVDTEAAPAEEAPAEEASAEEAAAEESAESATEEEPTAEASAEEPVAEAETTEDTPEAEEAAEEHKEDN